MSTFALVGVGGYIAPRHLQAIKETENNLVIAHDPNDSVGILDRYFPDCIFEKNEGYFLEWFERNSVDYVTICTPNSTHEPYITLMNLIAPNAKIICEKPLFIDPSDYSRDVIKSVSNNVYTILQLRLSETVKNLIGRLNPKTKYSVICEYITPRGDWYNKSWKGDKDKSGGLVFNIGIHIIDLLIYIFGKCLEFKMKRNDGRTVFAKLYLERADIDLYLSVERDRLESDENNRRILSIRDDNKNLIMDLNMKDDFEDLHIRSYKEILSGNGFTPEVVKPSIDLCYALSNTSG